MIQHISQKLSKRELLKNKIHSIYYRKCKNCGKDFLLPHDQKGRIKILKFCSRSCNSYFISKNRTCNEVRQEKCARCGKNIFVSKFDRKIDHFCEDCKYFIGSHICEHCGKEYFYDFRRDPVVLKTPSRFCSSSCAHARVRTEEIKRKIGNSSKNYYKNHPERKIIHTYNALKINSKRYGKEYSYRPLKYCRNCGKEISRESKTSLCRSCLNEDKDFKELQRIRNKIHEIGGWHTSKNIVYKGVRLGSNFEKKLVEDLDLNNIKWSKPSYFKWVSPIDNREHRYYPDIYLPDYDIYLDPKNDYLINNVNPAFEMKDPEKIALVEKQNNIKVLILNENQLSWNFIKDIIGLK